MKELLLILTTKMLIRADMRMDKADHNPHGTHHLIASIILRDLAEVLLETSKTLP